MQMQIPKDIVRLQFDYQSLISRYQGLEQVCKKQANELAQLKKINEEVKSNAENQECGKCKKLQVQIDQQKQHNKESNLEIESLQNSLNLKKIQFDEFREQVQNEMENRIKQFENLNQVTLERLDRVQKDNSLFEILLRERDLRIEQLNQIIYNQEQQLQQESQEDNTWKKKFIKINKDYHKLLSEYNSVKADLDAMYVSQCK
ncbi:unnamed protein product (macronuclear) [Paramecium tetraurelia]|uniref:Uncharacterized protein n=1 Tax=Paramecium tetraurelia TaxID=5888 RepID=A0CFU6_PARTE|nr:uncharacterized protein GSPATT00038105001 [Paramecium tetraurelia]CAK69663.1 unnamed protein product [Paramecium tetraurelia]|eukprot:XP_001437060.1 hypothetical protein (macronuclear) [Paramecium tetraurelia strain d4-2]